MNSTTIRLVQTIILSLFAIGLIVLGLAGYLTPLSRLVINPFVTAQSWLTTRYVAIQNAISAPQDLTRLRQRNIELEAEASRLQAEIIDLKQQLSETQILSALVDFARVHPENRYVAASVIGKDPNPFVKYVIINRGSDDGLRRGMPVVTQQGLVGRITAITAGAARVQLITDPASVVDVRLDPTKAEAVLLGQISGAVGMEMIPQTANIQISDLVLTSGLGGDYPANILIGQVSSIQKKQNDVFQTASVQPVVDFAQLEIVLIITNFQPVNINPLVPTAAVPGP